MKIPEGGKYLKYESNKKKGEKKKGAGAGIREIKSNLKKKFARLQTRGIGGFKRKKRQSSRAN